jgi:hypothetical protein
MSKKTHGSGSRTAVYYKIEVRTTYHQPTVLSEGSFPFVIDGEWREWPISPGSTAYGTNVPIKVLDRNALDHGLLPYEAAEAHRWALFAALEATRAAGGLCIETRLVSVQYKEEYSTGELGVSEPLQMPRRAWDAFAPRDGIVKDTPEEQP